MRRKDREITAPKDIADIIRRCDVCRLAFYDQGHPYLVPLNFGAVFDEKDTPTFYFHGAAMGTKMELFAQNPNVGFELDRGHRLVTGPRACDYSMEYESVCGNGVLSLVTDTDDKEKAFSAIMAQYAPGVDAPLDPRAVAATAVLKLTVHDIHGKRMRQG